MLFKQSEPLTILLAAKDERARIRKQFAGEKKPSVSLSLNVPGFPKCNEITNRFFLICLNQLKYQLKAHIITISEEDTLTQTDYAGAFFITSYTAPSLTISEIKDICEDFEENHPAGRFLDIDITDHAGNPVSSGKSKLCFYCGQKSADQCRRNNTHDINELRAFMFSKMEAFCQLERENDICRQLSSSALRAVLYEISLTPKPGLVDKLNTGIHADMNYQTFLNSSAFISTWFADLVHAGFDFRDKDLTRALPVIRAIGLQMEHAMFANTENVNTQKGLIFLMGISLFACGYLFSHQDGFEAGFFQDIVKKISVDLTSREHENNKIKITHGEAVYDRYGFPGARGETEKGFPMVFNFGLPVLLNYQELNDEVLIKSFLAIASQNNDTNIIYRGGISVLEDFKTLADKAFNQFDTENYKKLIDFCAQENISPGGTADLLAISIFIYFATTVSDKTIGIKAQT